MARAPSATGFSKPLLAIALGFVALASIYPDALGVPSEEILPHLFRHPQVVEGDWEPGEKFWLAPPWGRVGEAEQNGLIVSSVWPTLAMVRAPRSWPLLTETWQAAYLSYYARVLAPLLGGGVAGLRRSAALLGALGLLVVAAIGSRLGGARVGVVGAALLATSVGYLFIHRTAYLIESGPPLFAAIALWIVLRDNCSPLRLMLAGLSAGVAVALKVTAAWELLGMALFLFWSRSWPRLSLRVWLAAALASLVPLTPFALLVAIGGAPDVLSRKASLLTSPLAGLLRLPHDAWVVLTWLGDPMALLGPLLRGERDVPSTPYGALIAGAVFLFAVHRVVRGRNDCAPERLLLCTTTVVLVLTALLYDDRFPLQVAFLIAPWYALGVSRMLLELGHFSSVRIGRRGAAAALVLVAATAQGAELVRFQRAHSQLENPMLAGDAQRQLAAFLVAKNLLHPITTTYNAVGVIELWSDGTIQPIHLYRLLVPRPGDDRAAQTKRAEEAFIEALREVDGPVVLPLGENLFEGLHQDPALVREAFAAACIRLHRAPRELARFPAEGRALFAVIAVDGARE